MAERTYRMRPKVFEAVHHKVVFAYFVSVTVLAMVCIHPVYNGLCFALGAVYLSYLKGTGYLLRQVRFLLPMLLFITLINALSYPGGLSVLFYFFQNPVTVEAVVYGLCAGMMLCGVVLWIACWQAEMGGDVFQRLFGNVLPTISLMLTMIFRYIPALLHKGGEIQVSQQALTGNGQAGKKARFRQGVRLASVLMSWSMEDAIETADAMQARGYQSRRKSYRAAQNMRREDWALLTLWAVLFGAAVWALIQNNRRFMFYPCLDFSAQWGFGFALYAVLLALPLLLEGRERLRWAKYQ